MEEDSVEAVEASSVVPSELISSSDSKNFAAWFRSLDQASIALVYRLLRETDDSNLIDMQRPGLIRFFVRSTFYTAHGESALFIARTFYKTTAVIRHYSGLESVGLNRSLYESTLRSLLLEGTDHVVEVYEGSGSNWKLVKLASPGRLSQLEEELFRGSDGADAMPLIMAVSLSIVEGQRQVGLAFVDPSSRKLGVSQFLDDSDYLSFETTVVQLGARECVVPPNAAEGDGPSLSSDWLKLNEVLSRCNVMSTVRPKSFFSAKHVDSDLSKLLKCGNVEQYRDILDRKGACQSLNAVLSFSELLSDSTNHQKFDLVLYDQGQYMRLDAAAQRALNVTPPPPRQSDGSRSLSNSFSLLGLMGRARTPMGKRRVKAWLKQPLVNVKEIDARLDVVEAMVSDGELRERLRDTHLRGMPDIEKLTRKLEAKKLGLQDLCLLYRASAILPLIAEAIRSHQGPHANMLAHKFAEPLSRAHDADHLSKFEDLIEAAIDLDAIPDEYLVCASYDSRLKVLKAEKVKVEHEVESLAKAAARDLGLEFEKTLKLEWHRHSNQKSRCLRITQKEEKQVRAKLTTKYRVIEARKDGTKFTNKALESAAAELSQVSKQYEELQKELVAQVVAVAHTFLEVWDGVSSLLADLDVLLGFADLAISAPSKYVRPKMLPSDAGEIALVGSRHPCVEAQDGIEFIKNDCLMVKGKSWFNIITGPNMGGKSTFIRQVGVVVLMAQCGCFVPADEARISVRDAIFARVGAGDSALRGVSTFMAEMLETAAILKGATDRSLVIIDELGRGTSTYDGFGLAWAIAEEIMIAIRAPTLFATHFHELTELKGPGGVANLHVAAAVDPRSKKLTMLYQIRTGPCDQSFGIQVAESASFPPCVVELAKAKLKALEQGEASLKACSSGGNKLKRAREDEN
jgi:DNA mismatch repair protein MSH2